MHLRSSLRLTLFITLILASGFVAAPASAASNGLTLNTWIPYWKDDAGIEEVTPYLTGLDSVSPFVFEVDADGDVLDKAGLGAQPWKEFLRVAEKKRVDVYPSISWFDGQAIHETLSSKKKRAAHIKDLMRIVSKNKSIDGIEIDYESKLAETNPYFSTFLRELNKKLNTKKKDLLCTVEARTPKIDLYGPNSPQVTAPPVYANDYDVMNEVCDEVRVMAYDQGRAVVTLNKKNDAGYYAPIADPAWIRKVLASTTPQIAPSKIVLGVPTYGRVFRIAPGTNSYEQINSITYARAQRLAQERNVPVVRSAAGELSFSYTGFVSGLTDAAVPAGGPLYTYYVTFSDAVSNGNSAALAREYGLRGVALFKADGETDPTTWGTLGVRK
jgi:spore germination protein